MGKKSNKQVQQPVEQTTDAAGTEQENEQVTDQNPPPQGGDEDPNLSQNNAGDQSPPVGAPEESDDTKGSAKTRRARVLVAFGPHQPNDVIELSATDLKDAIAAGRVDDSAAAVKYALSLKK